MWNQLKHGATGMATVGTLCTLLAVLGGLACTGEGSAGLYKVVLTQIGYIQFLKYQVEMPDLQDFTLCVWVRSTNFSHPHPLFSYSKHEEQRLVRFWLQPPRHPPAKGQVKLEVLGTEVMGVPLGMVLGHWYHFCSSWNNAAGQWALHIDGKLAAMGQNRQLRGATIPGGGDVVVGQEYTDFDKGLDDGIEGEVFGFNLMTSQHQRGGNDWRSLRASLRASLRSLAVDRNSVRRPTDRRGRSPVRWPEDPKRRSLESNPGLELVEKSYKQCAARRGSPLDKSRLLVAWASTPVRVFGGAVIKPALPVCGAF